MKWRAVLGTTGVLALCACDPDPAPPPVVRTETPPPPVSQPASLTRADIVAAVALAASAHAAGAAPGEAATIAGRTFSLRLPFGCFGPAGSGNAHTREILGDGLAGWTWSEDRTAQTLTLTPADWTTSSLMLTPDAEPDWDHVDGYWIAWPWQASDNCPAATAPVAPQVTGAAADGTQAAVSEPPVADTDPSPFTAGLASIREADGSRLGRRPGSPYSFTLRATETAPLTAPVGGYRIVLAGRISTFPDGQTIRCTTVNPNRRPVCIAAVVLDSVAFETATGQRLSEWRPEG